MRVLGMHLQEMGSASVALCKLERTVRSITGLIRRIARSKEGITEADTLRLVRAFVISRVTYALPFQATRRTETDQVDKLIRIACMAALGILESTIVRGGAPSRPRAD
ncbi:hypothetical protein HPB50_008124 [Hyalomma asiaticum]|uniref:Uncharacterized protein n=1 Tax=Hyalomma asiaticum TaxID=266040 RepID=A0ACB7TGI6_HYAAI|nr:hypothetical protein HPB50_008124 [Hyalomma asiaticum]